MRSDASRVEDIGKAIEAIERHARRGRDEFLRDKLVQTWMLLRVILAHHYFRVDPELIWDTIERDIPQLKTSVTKIRTELSSSSFQ